MEQDLANQGGEMNKVLIIDDEAQHTALVRMRLAASGLEVLAAATAAGGAAVAATENPDLILLDLMLPDMRPEEAVKALRAVPCAAKTPIIAFTALDPLEIRRRRLDTEFSGVVTKPYEAGELVAKIKKILG